MSTDDPTRSPFSLRRWSRRKLEAARAVPEAVPAPPPVDAATPQAPGATAAAPAATSAEAPALPPVDSLTIDSDYTAFLQPKVDEGIRRQALRQLFRDPRFNVMDGLDVYIDDYSKSDPIPPEIMRRLVQGRYIFDPPRTRVGEDGAIEDVPDEDASVAAASAPEPEPEALPESAAPSLPTAAVPDVPEAAPSAPGPPGGTEPERR